MTAEAQSEAEASASGGARESRATPRPAAERHVGLLALALLLLGLAYRDLLLWDPTSRYISRTEGWFFLASDSSPQVVYAVVALLLFRRRAQLRSAVQSGGPLTLALPLLLAGSALFLWSQHVSENDLLLLSLVPTSLGAAVLLSGTHLVRAVALPILLLAFAIPLPAVLNNQIVFPVQLVAAAHSAWLLGVLGIPVVQEGDMLFLADRTFEIIETCSGLRSMEVLTLLAVACVSFFPVSRRHAVLLIAAAPAIGYAANLVRVIILILNPGSHLSAMHSLQGAAVFLGGSVVLFMADSLLRRIAPRREAREAPAVEPAGDVGRARAIGIAALFACLLAASIWMPHWSPRGSTFVRSIELPGELGDFREREKLALDLPFLWTLRFTKHEYRRYERRDEAVDVFVGYDDRLHRSQSLLSPKNAFPGRGWHVEARSQVELGAGGASAEAVLVRSGSTRVLSYYAYWGVAGVGSEIARAFLAIDESPLRRDRGAIVARVSTEVKPARDGLARAEARLGQVYQALTPTLVGLLGGQTL
jgi:exosortase